MFKFLCCGEPIQACTNAKWVLKDGKLVCNKCDKGKTTGMPTLVSDQVNSYGLPVVPEREKEVHPTQDLLLCVGVSGLATAYTGKEA